MRRRLAVMILLLVGLCVSIDAVPQAAPAEPTQAHSCYLPLILQDILPLDVVVTARGETIGYPSHVYLYGYVSNPTDQPYYGVQLELVETWYPYDPDGNSEPYTTRVRIPTALTATLPGQINPFARSLLLGKTSVSFGELYLADGRLPEEGEPRIVALEAGEWTHEDYTLSGTVRNASVHTVRGVRVVVATLGACRWRDTTVEKTRLLAGEETAFTADYFGSGCLGERVVVLGQGVVEAE